MLRTSHRDDRHIATVHEHGRELAVVHQAAIYLARDNGQIVLACDGADVAEVLGGEVAAAGVRRIADHNGAGAAVDQRVHRLEIAGPVLLRKQRIVSHRATQRLSDHLIQRKSGLGNKNVVTYGKADSGP